MTTFVYKTQIDAAKVDCSRRIYPDLHLGYDENHCIVIINRGNYDVQAKIDAAAAGVPSLAELCDQCPGNTPAEKLNNALSSGLIPDAPHNDGVTDYTEIPESINDFAAAGLKARGALNGTDFQTLLKQLVDDAIKAQSSAAASAADIKGEEK